ncbi:hypothetical protein SAMN05518684_105189 [Salipaludibacillus aurantiacus]|uniref:Uncharacterized protein n=2 Tax=Salipaludibacillus aurantiacus TaxID=1601833 RepID=A0A1H9TA69_9BACI|nr:hypothetical protein SAMN05518684_105189 [Salipaludibacillus aurantiacus]
MSCNCSKKPGYPMVPQTGVMPFQGHMQPGNEMMHGGYMGMHTPAGMMPQMQQMGMPMGHPNMGPQQMGYQHMEPHQMGMQQMDTSHMGQQQMGTHHMDQNHMGQQQMGAPMNTHMGSPQMTPQQMGQQMNWHQMPYGNQMHSQQMGQPAPDHAMMQHHMAGHHMEGASSHAGTAQQQGSMPHTGYVPEEHDDDFD